MLRRSVVRRYVRYQSIMSTGGWQLPPGIQRCNVRKEDLPKFFTPKSRDQWDYKRIDDRINRESEFRKTDHRPEWESLRDDMSEEVMGTTHTPSHYRLYHHFDEYANMKDKRLAAAIAVKEQWNSENFYFPGEEFMRNRPGFRSVPKELLNKGTHYKPLSIDFHKKFYATMRQRPTFPHWPPPGYKMQTMNCKKEFEFGAEDPSVVSEIERYYWYTMWRSDMNPRWSIFGIFRFAVFLCIWYYVGRDIYTRVVKRAMETGNYYPGRQMLRPWGVPRDWTDPNDHFWWQEPLDKFPCQGVIYWISRHDWGMIREENRRLEKEALGL